MNDYTWDLSPLYTGFDAPEFAADRSALDDAIAEMNRFAAECDSLAPSELVHGYIRVSERVVTLIGRLAIYANLRCAADTTDNEAASMMGVLMMKASETTAAEAILQKAVAALDDPASLADTDSSLDEYRYLLRRIKEDSRYLLTEQEEALFAKLNISGANAWSDMHSYLTSTAKAEYRGKEITLTEARNLAYDSDPAVREDALRCELTCEESIRDACAYALNSIKQQVLTECGVRGFSSPLEQALHHSGMKRETLDALLSAMQDYLPQFHKYLRAKAEYLGYTGGLRWQDLFAPIGKNDRKYTVEEAKDYLLGVFGQFDGEMHDLIRDSFAQRRIDFFPREGKVGGAFDCGIPAIGQSRVLTNFDGAFGDISTLAHELGHSFHDKMVFSHSPLTQDYSMPVAETASTFNETLVTSIAIKQAETAEEKLALLEARLSDAAQIICDIYSRYLFETAVFEQRSAAFLDADTLCAFMTDAQKTAYGDGLDADTLNPYMWVCKGHYYSGGLSFYNFPYAFGGLFARGLYAKYEKEGAAFVPVYKQMLHATSVGTVEETAKIAGIDLTDKAFWEAGLASYAEEIEEFCALVKR